MSTSKLVTVCNVHATMSVVCIYTIVKELNRDVHQTYARLQQRYETNWSLTAIISCLHIKLHTFFARNKHFFFTCFVIKMPPLRSHSCEKVFLVEIMHTGHTCCSNILFVSKTSKTSLLSWLYIKYKIYIRKNLILTENAQKSQICQATFWIVFLIMCAINDLSAEYCQWVIKARES